MIYSNIIAELNNIIYIYMIYTKGNSQKKFAVTKGIYQHVRECVFMI
jgi:hypothetical protein